MTRLKVKLGMRDQDEEISQRVSIPQQDIILGPDKPEEASQQRHHYPSQSNNEICDMDASTELPAISSPSDSLASRRKSPSASINPSAAAHPRMMMMTRTQSRRDIPVMESCKMRTVIEPDKSSSCGSLSRSAPPSQTKTNLNNSSNYKSCTELTTTSIMLLWIIMMTRRISKFWRSFRHPHHTPSHLHSNYNHHRRRVNSSCLRTFIGPLVICVLSNNASLLVHGQPPPLPPAGFLDFDNLPVTRFSCEGKVIGGYYADVETGCQMFHVCTLGQKDEIQDIKFLCLNGTIFDQETRVCERVDEVDCSKAEQFFDLNLDLYVLHATTQKPEEAEADLEEEDDNIRPVQTSARSKQNNNNTPPPPPPPPPPTTRPTTTTTTPTPSPRTRPPSSSLSTRTRSPPIISRPSSQRDQLSREQQAEEEEEEEEEDDDRNSGNNAYTSFNYYLKTPHSHVQSGYNSQSRQSYLINTAGSNGRGNEGSRGRGQSGPSGSGSTNNPVAATTSTGRKVPSSSGQKTIIYSSTSTSSSSTQRPKTVIVIKSTLPPTKSILRPKTLATPRTTTTTPIPPPKYELDDQYDEYYDDEDYPLEQQQPQQQQQQQQQSKSSTSFQQSYPSNKPTLSGNYDFRDGRSTKGIANAGQIIHSTTGRSSSTSDRSKSTIVVSRQDIKATPKPVLVSPANIKVISSEFIGTNSTEDPYYYEDDYPDDATLQQQQQEQLRQAGYSSTSPSSHGKSVSSRGHVVVSSSSKGKSGNLEQSKIKPGSVNVNKEKEPTSSADTSDYYDDDTDNVNPHDHHFTHVDVPRIPFAKPNVPRVLVTNGKPFLPRLRRQSHYNHYFSPAFSPPLQQQRHHFIRDHFLLPESPSRPLQRSTASLLDNNFQSRVHHHPEANHHHHPPQQHHQTRQRTDIIRNRRTSPTELRREARAKAIDWGRDRPFR